MADWPHAPVHRLEEGGTFIVTAGTYGKQHFFRGADRLALLQDCLLSTAKEWGWRLQAWAVFSNHYHFVALSPASGASLSDMIKRLHTATAVAVNEMDGTAGRRVWFEYWDTRLTYEKSYLARLKYVRDNAVHHGLVPVADKYPWCSAAWFERTADRSFINTVNSLKTDRLNVFDEYEAETPTLR
ncbi:MAG: transposase [Armatimonadetes bacterium]|nr:transposase [Armatimonadota bacterium]